MCRSIIEHGGVVNKFLGDGLLAFWAPDPGQEREAARLAVSAAVCIAPRLTEQAAPWYAAVGRELEFGTTVHSGPAWLGFVGTPKRLEFTALGHAVSQCCRLQQALAASGSRVLVSRDALQMADMLGEVSGAGGRAWQRGEWDGLPFYRMTPPPVPSREGSEPTHASVQSTSAEHQRDRSL